MFNQRDDGFKVSPSKKISRTKRKNIRTLLHKKTNISLCNNLF